MNNTQCRGEEKKKKKKLREEGEGGVLAGEAEAAEAAEAAAKPWRSRSAVRRSTGTPLLFSSITLSLTQRSEERETEKLKMESGVCVYICMRDRFGPSLLL